MGEDPNPDLFGLYLIGIKSPHLRGSRFSRAIAWLKNNKETWQPLATLLAGVITGGVAAGIAVIITLSYNSRQTTLQTRQAALQTRQALSSAYLALGDKDKKVPAIRSLAVYADEFEENTLDILVDMLDDDESTVRRAAIDTLKKISRKNFSTVRKRLRKELESPNHPSAAGIALATIDSQLRDLGRESGKGPQEEIISQSDVQSDAQLVLSSFGADTEPKVKGDCAESVALFVAQAAFGDKASAAVQQLIDSILDRDVYSRVLIAFRKHQRQLTPLLTPNSKESLRSYALQCVRDATLEAELRSDCAKLLIAIGTPDDAVAIASLGKEFFQGNFAIRLVEVLGDLGDERVLQKLEWLRTKSDSASLREWAESAIRSVRNRVNKAPAAGRFK